MFLFSLVLELGDWQPPHLYFWLCRGHGLAQGPTASALGQRDEKTKESAPLAQGRSDDWYKEEGNRDSGNGQRTVVTVSARLSRSAHGCLSQRTVVSVSAWLSRSAHGCHGQRTVATVSARLPRTAHGCPCATFSLTFCYKTCPACLNLPETCVSASTAL